MSQHELLASHIIVHTHHTVLGRFQVSIILTFLVQNMLLDFILNATAWTCSKISRPAERYALSLLVCFFVETAFAPCKISFQLIQLLLVRVLLSMDLACPDLQCWWLHSDFSCINLRRRVAIQGDISYRTLRFFDKWNCIWTRLAEVLVPRGKIIRRLLVFKGILLLLLLTVLLLVLLLLRAVFVFDQDLGGDWPLTDAPFPTRPVF